MLTKLTPNVFHPYSFPVTIGVAEIVVNNVRYGLGSFNSINDAVAAREKAEVEFNFHKSHGGEKIERC